MMKSIYAICLAAPIVLLATACGSNETVVSPPQSPETPEPIGTPASSPSPNASPSPEGTIEQKYETPSGDEVEIETDYDD